MKRLTEAAITRPTALATSVRAEGHRKLLAKAEFLAGLTGC